MSCDMCEYDEERRGFDEGSPSFEGEVVLASTCLTTAPSRDEDVALFGGGQMEWWVRSTHTPGHVTWEAGRCRVRHYIEPVPTYVLCRAGRAPPPGVACGRSYARLLLWDAPPTPAE